MSTKNEVAERLLNPEWFGDESDPRFQEWLASLPKSKVRYKDEYAPSGECIRCFGAKNSQAHVKGTPGYMHEYVNPADLEMSGRG